MERGAGRRWFGVRSPNLVGAVHGALCAPVPRDTGTPARARCAHGRPTAAAQRRARDARAPAPANALRVL